MRAGLFRLAGDLAELACLAVFVGAIALLAIAAGA